MHDFKEKEAQAILKWFEPIISTISVNLDYLQESFESKQITDQSVKNLIKMIENLEFLDEFEDFCKKFNKFKAVMSTIINKLFIEQADTNLYEIYSFLYTIDNVINIANKWFEISAKRSLENKEPLDFEEIKELIAKDSQEDLDEFGKIATEYQLLGKDEQKLFNVIALDDVWTDVEEGITIFIELYEISHPLSFLLKTSREMQNIETTSYYILIRIQAMISFFNYWSENFEMDEEDEGNFDDEVLDELTLEPNPDFKEKLIFADDSKLEVQLEEMPEYQAETEEKSDDGKIKVVNDITELVSDLDNIRSQRFKK
ncbi:hypothetical protein [Spiroplasma alleghenense]|uniref:Uncharacterized protein n=1 Tax=Spiroplasma alleghenense TaxID=216931 RepID=A0A345Z3F1_9MOLU|nr:hypothetical protein [Spiroplasma alleghenense]AXK51130.1 hypothetical protein SALLE_v1c04560 [Spiroplasma alleghenense]